MSLSQPVKILIGLLTAALVVAPLLLVFGFFVPISLIPLLERASSLRGAEAIFALFPLLLFPGILCFNVLHFSLQVFYVVQVVKNPALTDTPRILYLLGLFFLPFIAMPIYFFMHLIKDAPPDPAM
jgi:hypothetical protein